MLPFNLPYSAEKQDEYVLQALSAPNLQGGGKFCMRAEETLSQILGAEKLLLTPSASHALELAFFRLVTNDEVIIPAYNFPSAANAVLRGGGMPVLCDIDQRTQNIDPAQAERLINKNTVAICVTHYAGIACDMDVLEDLCRQHGLLLIEDAAQGIGATFLGKPLGALGDAACISFHSTKNVTCGEGGVYIQNSSALDFSLQRMRQEKGTNRHTFNPATEEFYRWETIGTSHLMSEITAAILLAQLEELEAITAARLAIKGWYDSRLARLFSSGRLTPMHTPGYADGNGHIYYFLCHSAEDKHRIRALMAGKGFPCLPHYDALHLGGMGKALGYSNNAFPHSEHTAATLLRLPIYPSLNEDRVDEICQALRRAAA